MKKIALITALIVFVVWSFFTFGLKFITGDFESEVALSEQISSQLNYGIFLAAATVVLFAFIGRSHIRMGLSGSGKYTDKILIIPYVIITLCLIHSYMNGAFSNTDFIKWVLINTFFVGISEELMFRGVFMSSLTSKYGYWPAVIFTSVLFGVVHIVNGFTTGDFGLSAIQSLLAMSTGLLFLAIRVKTLNIIPAVILHWIWDFTVFTTGTVEKSKDDMVGLIITLLVVIGPIIFGILGILALRKKQMAEVFVASQT